MIRVTYPDLLDRARALPLAGHALYGVPRGGVYAALLAASAHPGQVALVEDPAHATAVIDDIVDSGKTRARYGDNGRPFFALVDKRGRDAAWAGEWVSFPWERAKNETGPEDAVVRLLQYLGEDPEREGLRETPARVLKSYAELFAGYRSDPAALMKTFQDGACDELVALKNIAFTSFCEHHLLPFGGVAHVGYLPAGRVIGLSKLARLVDVFARRLQVQERLTVQVSQALMDHLRPVGAGCVIEATHSCMSCRGVRKEGAVMVTSSLLGEFRTDPAVRQEFLKLVGR